jgi:hypothetical protein
MAYTADQLATIIKMAAKKDMPDFGEDEEQNFYIFEWINMFLFQNAKKIRMTATSDELAISATDYVDFLVSGVVIDDMYEPYQILDANDKAVTKRTSFDNTNSGWYRESAFSKIHARGLNGVYRLKYIKYPTKITLGTQSPELPPAGYGELISWVVSRIKLTKNYLDESKSMLSDAQSVTLATVKAAQSGMGTNAQQPGPDDAKLS